MVASGAADFHAASVRAHHHDLIQGLIALQPKKRANKVSWVIFAGCAYFVVALLGDHSVREALLAPKGEARVAQYTAPEAPRPSRPIQVQPPVQVAQSQQSQQSLQFQQPVQVAQVQQQPAVVTFAPFAVPAADLPSPDGPLPHAKAHHTAPTHRAHPRGAKHGK